MTDTAQMPPDAIARGLAELGAAVGRMAAAAVDGGVVDLAGLDAEAARLCTAATLLPPHDARPLLPRLEALLSALDALETTLQRLAAAAQADADEATRRQRAAAAYGRSGPDEA
jgi:hypothetical protein